MAHPFPEYDALYSISDLHLGGFDGSDSNGRDRSYRIFRDPKALVWTIDLLREISLTKHLALVLNGDIVDFLADAQPTHFDPENAHAKLQTAIEDREQKEVWAALRNYLRDGQGDLVLALGNHDVELGLPEVKGQLVKELAGDDIAARGRLRLALDGTGFRATVGGRSILCVHGNEADPWNVVDHVRLLQISRSLNRGEKPKHWRVNAGTTLVIDAMNQIKRDYQWVDLLKPEEDTVALVLAAVAPDLTPEIENVASIVYRGALDWLRRGAGWMGDPAGDDATNDDRADNDGADNNGAATAEERRFRRRLHAHTRAEESASSALIEEALCDLAEGIDPLSLAEDSGDAMLGPRRRFRLARRIARVRQDPDQLRGALIEMLHGDDSFNPNTPDHHFGPLEKMVGEKIDFLLAGHTHHAKAHRRKNGRGVYLNSGTWIQIMRLGDDALAEENWPQTWDILRRGELTEIEEANVNLLARPRNVTRVELCGGTVAGSIHTVTGATRDEFKLKQVENSKTLTV